MLGGIVRRPLWLEQSEQRGEREEVKAGREWRAGCLGPCGHQGDLGLFTQREMGALDGYGQRRGGT